MGIDEKIDLLNRNYIYEEGIFDFRKLYQNKKKILFKCIDIYLRKKTNIGYNKLLQLFYNKIGFEESIEYNANIFNSIDKMDENFCNNLVYMMLHNKPLIDNNNVLTYFESKANLCDSLYKEIGDSDFYSFRYDGEYLEFNDRIKYLKCLIYIKKYGVNSNFIEDFLYAFSEDIDKINISQNILSLFQELLYIYTTNNIEELKKYMKI